MNDGIIKGNGDSRYLKSVVDFLSRYPTYEAFAQALIAGTLPVDLNGINTEGWTQVGTSLNKSTLLKDATAGSFGLGADAVPDDVLSILKDAVLNKNGDFVTPSGTSVKKAKVVVGSYTGTGTYGRSNLTSITFPVAPLIWGIIAVRLPTSGWVYPVSHFSPWNPKSTGATKIQMFVYTSETYGPFKIVQSHPTYSGSKVSWWSPSAEEQNNILNAEYYYFGIVEM